MLSHGVDKVLYIIQLAGDYFERTKETRFWRQRNLPESAVSIYLVITVSSTSWARTSLTLRKGCILPKHALVERLQVYTYIYSSGFLTYDYHASNHIMGSLTGDITPRVIILLSSSLTCCLRGKGTLLGVQRQRCFESFFSLMTYSSPKVPSPLKTPGYSTIELVFVMASIFFKSCSPIILERLESPNILILRLRTT